MSPEQYAAFLETLKIKKFGGFELCDIPLDKDLQSLFSEFINGGLHDPRDLCQYLFERARRLEANAKPPTLLEDVKACVRSAVNAADLNANAKITGGQHYEYYEFRRLSEPGENFTQRGIGNER